MRQSALVCLFLRRHQIRHDTFDHLTIFTEYQGLSDVVIPVISVDNRESIAADANARNFEPDFFCSVERLAPIVAKFRQARDRRLACPEHG